MSRLMARRRKTQKTWTSEELARLRAIYPNHTAEECAAMIGRSVSSVRNATHALGLHKSTEFLASERSGRISALVDKGRAHRFKPGHTTWNRGMRGLRQLGGETKFKAGNMPHTYRPVGSERVDRDGILWRKVADTRNRRIDWRPVHVTEWEKVNGALPAGKVVIFADGNRRNFEPSNLLALSRAELMKRNTVQRYGKEIAQLCQLRGALLRQIRKREPRCGTK